MEKHTNATDILDRAAQHMEDRATAYDAPGGERSMAGTVEAFNALTPHSLTEEQGWLFMVLLKCSRCQQGDYRDDNYEDGTAYMSLMGEAASVERQPQYPSGMVSDAVAYSLDR